MKVKTKLIFIQKRVLNSLSGMAAMISIYSFPKFIEGSSKPFLKKIRHLFPKSHSIKMEVLHDNLNTKWMMRHCS